MRKSEEALARKIGTALDLLGSMKYVPREREIETHFIIETRKRLGEVRKVKWIGRAHAPDRLALLPLCHFYAELKRPGKRATGGQVREHNRMRASNIPVLVLDTPEKINDFYANYDKITEHLPARMFDVALQRRSHAFKWLQDCAPGNVHAAILLEELVHLNHRERICNLLKARPTK